MVLERAEIVIQEGRMEEFVEVLRTKAIPLTGQFTGLISFRALRGVEDVNSAMFLAEWESVEAHLASRPEPAHEQFWQLVLPFVVGSRSIVHFDPV